VTTYKDRVSRRVGTGSAPLGLPRGTSCSFPGKALVAGRLMSNGQALASGFIHWTWHPCCKLGAFPFVMSWGASLDLVPGNDQERARRMSGPSASSASRPGLTAEQQLVVAAGEVVLAVVLHEGAKDAPADFQGQTLALVARKGRERPPFWLVGD
jgi:hypothetical protein